MRIFLSFVALTAALSYASLAQTFVNEPVKVRNYRRSPVQLRLVRSWINVQPNEKWGETCLEVEVNVLTKQPLSTLSYEIGPRGERPYVFAVSGIPRPGEVMTGCVRNDQTRDEKEFVIKIPFVEDGSGNVIWESREHRNEMRRILGNLESE